MDIFNEISLNVISFLENHSGVTGVEYSDKPAASSRDISTWEKDNYPHLLSDDIKSFLQVSNGLLLRWKIKHQGKVKPLGCMSLNALSSIVPVPDPPTKEIVSNQSTTAFAGSSELPAPLQIDVDLEGERCTAFELDKDDHGLVAIVYTKSGKDAPEVWFRDLAGEWHFVARTFKHYFRLMIMHLGLPSWQYAFTSVGLDPISQQWFRLLSPERLAIDLEAHEQRYGGGGGGDGNKKRWR